MQREQRNGYGLANHGLLLRRYESAQHARWPQCGAGRSMQSHQCIQTNRSLGTSAIFGTLRPVKTLLAGSSVASPIAQLERWSRKTPASRRNQQQHVAMQPFMLIAARIVGILADFATSPLMGARQHERQVSLESTSPPN